MDSSLQKQYQATAVRVTYVNLATPMTFGYKNSERQVTARDPNEVLRMMPEGVVCFRFYDRIVADVEVDGETVTIRSEMMNFSVEQYFVGIDRVIARSEFSRRFASWRNGRYPGMLRTMDEHRVDHVVCWDNPAHPESRHRYMAFKPRVDRLVWR